MKPLSLALALWFLPSVALAKGDCLQRCTSSLSNCQSTCGAAMACGRRCNNQFDGCIASCEKQANMQPQPLPTKCPGPKGRMISCTDYLKTDTKPTKQQVELEAKMKKEQAAHGGSQPKDAPSP